MRQFYYVNITQTSDDEKLLPIALHYSEKDLPWLKENVETISESLNKLVLDNIEEIERKASGDSKNAYTRFPPQKDFSACYSTSNGFSEKMLKFSKDSEQASSCEIFSFNLLIWIVRNKGGDQHVELPTDFI
jgi:hypothetical protein